MRLTGLLLACALTAAVSACGQSSSDGEPRPDHVHATSCADFASQHPSPDEVTGADATFYFCKDER